MNKDVERILLKDVLDRMKSIKDKEVNTAHAIMMLGYCEGVIERVLEHSEK